MRGEPLLPASGLVSFVLFFDGKFFQVQCVAVFTWGNGFVQCPIEIHISGGLKLMETVIFIIPFCEPIETGTE